MKGFLKIFLPIILTSMGGYALLNEPALYAQFCNVGTIGGI